MPIETVTSWGTLFRLAAASGRAKKAYLKAPTAANLEAYEDARDKHENYRILCLEADRMEGLTSTS